MRHTYTHPKVGDLVTLSPQGMKNVFGEYASPTYIKTVMMRVTRVKVKALEPDDEGPVVVFDIDVDEPLITTLALTNYDFEQVYPS